MKSVRGVQFRDDVASSVEGLIERIEEFAGKNSLYLQYEGICFALRTPNQSKAGKRKAAYRIFAQVKPTKEGAELKRPRVPKSEPKCSSIAATNLEELVLLAKSWHDEVTEKPKPLSKERTEHPLMLAGGQFESKRARH